MLNPSFESSKYTENGVRELPKTGYIAHNWYVPLSKRSPHLYMKPDRAIAKANSGSNAIGMVLGGPKKKKTKYEYVTGELSEPLVQGQAYCVTFNLLLHRSSKWVATDVGVLFHHDQGLIANTLDRETLEASIYVNRGEEVTNTKWFEYNGYYVASGGEQFISFGSFGEGESVELKELGIKPYFQVDGLSSKAYYQLDDVAVVAQDGSVDCGCAQAPLSEDVEIPEDLDLQPYLFALDASGSMKRGGMFDSLRTNLVDLLEQLPMGTPVTFSTFSSESSLLYADKLNGGTAAKVDSLLAAIELAGGTSVYSGLENAAESWVTSGRDSARIVLISDGNFSVTNKIEDLVKDQYVNKGRRLTVIQIASKAKGTDRLEPYQTSFVQVELSELRNAVFQIQQVQDFSAIACECVDVYSDTMNYHFVVDYSGSMKLFRKRAKKVLMNLYEKAPESAVISITAFSTTATQLYNGKKSEMSMDELEALLEGHVAAGGTLPAPGIIHGLDLAEEMSAGRFSHLIVITDLEPEDLNEQKGLKSVIWKKFKKIDLAVSSVTVDLETQLDIMVSGRAQFDMTTGIFREVSKNKFENDLFDTQRSGCDYTTQPYHYNPFSDQAKKEAKKTVGLIIKELFGVSVSLNTGS